MAANVGKKRLFAAWGLLVGLTMVSIVGGKAETGAMTTLGPLLFALVMVVTTIKAHQILNVYLGLRHSSAAWRAGFGLSVWCLCGILWGIYVPDQWL